MSIKRKRKANTQLSRRRKTKKVQIQDECRDNIGGKRDSLEMSSTDTKLDINGLPEVIDLESGKPRFTLGKLLGEGMYGVVHEAWDEQRKEKVAMKIMQEDAVRFVDVSCEKGIMKLPLEACLQARMHHKNVLKIYGIAFFPGHVVLVLERPTGFISLKEYCKENSISGEEAKIIMDGIFDGMSHCLEQKVLHQDLSANNVLIHPVTLETKVIDFGCADHLQRRGHFKIFANREATPPEYWKLKDWSHDMYDKGYSTPDLEHIGRESGRYPVYGDQICAWECGAPMYHLFTRKFVYAHPNEISFDLKQVPQDFRTIVGGLLKENPHERMSVKMAKSML